VGLLDNAVNGSQRLDTVPLPDGGTLDPRVTNLALKVQAQVLSRLSLPAR
jgi:hypothetical protein